MNLTKILQRGAIAAAAVAAVALATPQAGYATTSQDIEIIKRSAKSVDMDKELERCFVEASKREQPAPPVDPKAVCRGKIRVEAEVTAMAKCKDGSAKATATSKVNVWVNVEAKSQAIASGIAEARAQSIAMGRAKTMASARVKCATVAVHTQQNGGGSSTVTTAQATQEDISGKVSELPNTGPASLAMSAVGSGALGVAIRGYLRSRHGL